MSTNTAEQQPAMMENSRGHFVPIGMVEEIDKARTDLVAELVDRAQKQRAALVDFKAKSMADVVAFVQLSAEWAEEGRDEIKVMLLDAFEVNKEGHISTAKVLNLCSYKIDDPRWQQGVKAIYDSMHIQGSTAYIRFYQRENAKAKWQAIPLDLAAV